jgi:type I restriction enzyme, S subunit
MKRYDSYKDSGIEWIGEIPSHWGVKKIKHSIELIMGQSPNSDNCNSLGNGIPFLQGNADFCSINPLPQSWCEKPTKIAPANSILLSVRAPIGAVNIADNDYCIGRGLCALISHNPKFWYYNSLCLHDELNSLGTGSTFKAISTEQILNTFTIDPPPQEQTAIAAYLDRKTAEIDELIADKKRLLELYDEEKTAIINQAVTKGLNPDVPMKDSGIEWLGEIPEHWEVKRLKYVAHSYPSNVDKKTKEGEQEVLLCNYVDVYKNDFIKSDLSFMKATASASQIEKFKLKKGDVIVTKDSETPDDIAVPALVLEDFENVICGYHLNFISPFGIKGEYLFRFFQSEYTRAYFFNNANGVTRYGIGTEKFLNFSVCIPSYEEQQSIVQHIETECARIDAKKSKTEKLIELLTEYRTALISEVVTGKVKVTG